MNKYLPFAILAGIATSFSSWAINVGDITSIMTSEQSSLRKKLSTRRIPHAMSALR